VDVGGPAAEANRRLGSEAFTAGNRIGFAKHPSLQTAAHEAAHVIQQRHGAAEQARTAGADTRYEHGADLVADAVVRGQPASGILDLFASGPAVGTSATRRPRVQLKRPGLSAPAPVVTPLATEIPWTLPLLAGGIDVRRVIPDRLDNLLALMKASAAKRRGYGGFHSEPASLAGSGVAARINAFLSNINNYRRGSFDSGWVDDNGSRRFFDAWDYEMRLQITSIRYQSPVATGVSGQHGGASTSSTTGSVSEELSRAVTGSAKLGGGVKAGGQGKPEGSLTGEAGVAQTTTEKTGTQEGTSGVESFTRGEQAYGRYSADLVADYQISFRPGATLGIFENRHQYSQTFADSASFGTVVFDYTTLR